MEINPHPNQVLRRLGLFELRLDDKPEQMMVYSALDSLHGPPLRDRWLFARLGALSTQCPMKVSVSKGQLRRIVNGLDELIEVASHVDALETGMHMADMADALRTHIRESDGHA